MRTEKFNADAILEERNDRVDVIAILVPWRAEVSDADGVPLGPEDIVDEVAETIAAVRHAITSFLLIQTSMQLEPHTLEPLEFIPPRRRIVRHETHMHRHAERFARMIADESEVGPRDLQIRRVAPDDPERLHVRAEDLHFLVPTEGYQLQCESVVSAAEPFPGHAPEAPMYIVRPWRVTVGDDFVFGLLM